MPADAPATSLTLLDCLRQTDDNGAWERFVHLYAPLIHTWARREGFGDADVQDVTQDVLMKLVQELPRYEHKETFRSWLFAVVRNQGNDFRRRRGTRSLPQAEGLSGIHNFEHEPGTEFEEAEFSQYIVHRALELIRAEFDDNTWLVFKRHRLEGVPVPAITKELGIPERTIYRSLNEVLTRLRREIGGFLA